MGKGCEPGKRVREGRKPILGALLLWQGLPSLGPQGTFRTGLQLSQGVPSLGSPSSGRSFL